MGTKRLKTPACFTVRNATGQYLGTWVALTPAQAIQKFMDDQARTAATFRRSQPMLKFEGLTATVESNDGR